MSTAIGKRKSDQPLNDVFSAYEAVGAAIAATPSTVLLDVEHVPSTAVYSLANGEVSVAIADPFEVAFGVTCLVSSGNARTQVQAWLERNDIEVPGTRVMLYCRQANHGASGSVQLFLTLAQGDVLRVRVQRTVGSGSVSTLAGGSRLALRRL